MRAVPLTGAAITGCNSDADTLDHLPPLPQHEHSSTTPNQTVHTSPLACVLAAGRPSLPRSPAHLQWMQPLPACSSLVPLNQMQQPAAMMTMAHQRTLPSRTWCPGSSPRCAPTSTPSSTAGTAQWATLYMSQQAQRRLAVSAPRSPSRMAAHSARRQVTAITRCPARASSTCRACQSWRRAMLVARARQQLAPATKRCWTGLPLQDRTPH
jgi:hypothetical protein